MKQSMLKKAIKKVFHAFNLDIVRANRKTPLDDVFSIFRQSGFQPKHIVDIGANHGTWTREALHYFPDAYYTLVEPQGWLKDSIKDILDRNKKVSFHAVGAGEKEGTFKFTVHDKDHSSSFRYTEEDARDGGFKQLDIPVVTLNGLLANSEKPAPDIIKIDAEGLDMEVLKGASNFLGQAEVIMVEAVIVNKEFNNSILEMLSFMDRQGYRLFDLTDLNRPLHIKVLWLIELVFVKKGGYLDSYPFSRS
jgi:FkbM family methyltransferase